MSEIITVSRQLGSLGDEIASALASKLGWQLITRKTILNRYLKPIATENEFLMLQKSPKFYLRESKENISFIDYAKNRLNELSEKESIVLVGFGSQIIFANKPEAIHVRITAPESVRMERVKRQYNVAKEEALNILRKADRKHKRFVSNVFNADLSDPYLYDLTLNTAQTGADSYVASIMGLYKEKKLIEELSQESEDSQAIARKALHPDFKHPAESEFARILDMYHIDWKYEPKTFPIEWDAEGNVTSAFSPDFYLPKFDTYLELTTMNQKYVTMKNRKAKMVQELYPGTNVKIVYKKDFQSLVERFSKQGG